MHILGAILTGIGIICLACGCVMSLKKMQKLQDYNFKAKNPTEYKRLKASFTPYIVVGGGIFAFIIGFILLNFV